MGMAVRSPSVSSRLLIVDDDDRLAGMLSSYLGERGYEVAVRPDGASGVEAALSGDFDAVVLDVMLPDFDGFEVCRRIRASSMVPVVMLTARGDEMDRIVGLEIGADDYLPKPFNPRELLARLKAVMRRAAANGHAPEGAQGADVLRFDELEIDRGALEVRVSGRRKRLTAHQFAILDALASNPGRVMTRDALMRSVRGHSLEAFDRSIDVHVSRIRQEIEDDPKDPRRIITVRGVGYIFARKGDGGAP